MEKLLTVSVAAYNVQDYIRENLDSMIIPEIMDQLEVFIVDDGGSDDTLSIAKEYHEKYPDTFIPVHKENGGYGTTVNYSIEHATGKFFKLLDGDDWFDSNGLKQLVETLKDCRADVVVNPYYNGCDKDSLEVKKCNWMKLPNKLYLVSELTDKAYLSMWATTYRTEILKKSGMVLPEHTLYTDQVFCVEPMLYAEVVQFEKYPVYCYRIGREGQSVSKEARLKHFDDQVSVCDRLFKFAESDQVKESKNCDFIVYRGSGAYRTLLLTLLLLPKETETLKKIIKYEKRYRNLSYAAFKKVADIGKFGMLLKLLRRTRYRTYDLIKDTMDFVDYSPEMLSMQRFKKLFNRK